MPRTRTSSERPVSFMGYRQYPVSIQRNHGTREQQHEQIHFCRFTRADEVPFTFTRVVALTISHNIFKCRGYNSSSTVSTP